MPGNPDVRQGTGQRETQAKQMGGTVQEKVEARLEELQKEFEVGQQRLRAVEVQEADLRQTLLRISGAIQILQELLEEGEAEPPATTPLARSIGGEGR